MTLLPSFRRLVRIASLGTFGTFGTFGSRSDHVPASAEPIGGKLGLKVAVTAFWAWALGALLLFRPDAHRGVWLGAYAVALTLVVSCLLAGRQRVEISAAEAEALAWENSGSGSASSDR